VERLKVSVIMLTCNREAMVSRAIESVLKQTFTDFEYIIVNNGSTDKSGFIADEYARTDHRIQVIHRENGSIGHGRNAGLNVAKGEYIAFVDDDDYCEADFLEHLYNLAADNEAEISICGTSDKTFDEKHIMKPEEAIIYLLWRKYYNTGFPTKLIKRHLFNHLRFPENTRYDDIYLMPKILANANLIAYHGLGKYVVFRHENNNSAWTSNHSLLTADILDEYLRVYYERTNWLCEAFPESIETWQYFMWSFMISMVEKINRLGIIECEALLNNMLNELQTHRDNFINNPNTKEFEKKWIEAFI